MFAFVLRERVSRDSAPAPRTSEVRDVVRTTIRPKMIAAITTIAMTIPVLMTVRSLLQCCWGYSLSSSQFKEDSVTPWEGEVESGTAEERTDDYENCPEHKEQGEH